MLLDFETSVTLVIAVILTMLCIVTLGKTNIR